MPTSPKRSPNGFELDILLLINASGNHGISTTEISKKLNISKSALSYYWNKLKQLELIIKKGYGCWELTDKGKQEVQTFLIGYEKKPDFAFLHALQFTMPILEDKTYPGFWDKETHVTNWSYKIKKTETPIGITIKKNTRQIQVYVWSRIIKKPEEITNLAFRAAFYTWHYLEKHGMKVDIFSIEQKNVEIAIRDKEIEKVIPSGTTIRIDLGRKAASVFGNSRPNEKPKKAEAWTDPSPERSLETNDIQYYRNYLLMPENLNKMLHLQAAMADNLANFSENIDTYNQNIKKHLSVLESMDKTLKIIRNSVTQTNLWRWKK